MSGLGPAEWPTPSRLHRDLSGVAALEKGAGQEMVDKSITIYR